MADAASQTYDVVIIGGGPGGYNAAIRAGQLGLKVAIIEMRTTLGGTCLNVGCMPSKALLHASELYEAANTEFAGIGIEVKPKLNLGQMHKAKDDSVEALTKGIEFLMKKNKVVWLKGRGRIVGEEVVTSYGGDLEVFVEKQIGERVVVRLTGSNLLDSSKDEVFDKFNTIEDQIGRDYDEYELETETAGPWFQLVARMAF